MSTLIVNLIVLLIVAGLIWYLIGLLPLPAPIKTIIDALFIIALILLVLGLFTGRVAIPALR